MPSPKVCLNCGKELPPANEACCSRACWNALGAVQVTCEVCGRQFWHVPGKAAGVEGHVLCSKCAERVEPLWSKE